MKRVDLETFLELGKSLPTLDVRSPIEYHTGHLPNALNLPLLSDEERVEVGTLYKQVSPQAAFKRGLEFIGPKMAGYIDYAETLGSQDLLVHCWRGGKRSESVAWLLESYGLRTHVLEGGYKSYRTAAITYFNQPLPLLVLTGYTGSQKTEVLHALRDLGEQVVDLEGLACHQGSTFGKPIDRQQPPVEQFQNMLYETFRPFDLGKRIWIEDEPMRIGSVNLVPELFRQKNEAPLVFLEMTKEARLNHLVKNYGTHPMEKLIEATLGIQKKLGGKETKEVIDHIRSGRALEAATLLLTYYDKRYALSIEKHVPQVVLHLAAGTEEPKEIANKLIERMWK